MVLENRFISANVGKKKLFSIIRIKKAKTKQKTAATDADSRRFKLFCNAIP